MNLFVPLLVLASAVATTWAEVAVPLGGRRELLADKHLISRMEDASLKLHKPEAHDVALVCDAPWEGNTSGYFTLLQDDGLFRC